MRSERFFMNNQYYEFVMIVQDLEGATVTD
jgi:hypothetical protein